MNKIHSLYEYYPACLYCSSRAGLHKKSYPSYVIARQIANNCEVSEDSKLYVYECPHQNNRYHLSKSPSLQYSDTSNFGKLQEIDGEVVINWHILESCNFDCKYCYAQWGKKSSLDEENTIKLLCEISDLGKKLKKTVRLSIAGGEPFLDRNLGFKIETAHKLGLKVSLITNGYKLEEKFVKEYAGKLEIIGVSIDSFHDDVCYSIGRATNSGELLSIKSLKSCLNLAQKINPELQIKVNTVVNRYNWQENMSEGICQLSVDKWKVIRVLGNIKSSKSEEISGQQFKHFCEQHKNISFISIEDNECMRSSYLMIDPASCFFWNSPNALSKEEEYQFSKPILEVGIRRAIEEVCFDASAYEGRYRS